MGNIPRHGHYLARLGNNIFFADRYTCFTIKNMHHGIAGCGVCAQAFAGIKGKQCQTDGTVLGKGTADYAALFIVNEFREHMGF